jgi:hypothetical protein
MDINTFSFLASRCRERLTEAGYSVPTGSDEDIVLAYNNVWLHRVPVRPRSICKASNYLVPEELLDGEKQFLEAVVAGQDLRPYQSTRLEDATNVDGMLFDFGIQHFHMGVTTHPTKPNFKARTDPLLFARVNNDCFFCLGFFSHGAWSQRVLLDLMHANWPKLLEPFAIKGVIGLSRTYTDAEHATLRKSQINVLTARPDGTIHMTPGGGLTTAGGSLKATIELNTLRTTCDDFDIQIAASLGALGTQKVKLEHTSGKIYAIVPQTQALLEGFPDPPAL